jgi:hypothetical protein
MANVVKMVIQLRRASTAEWLANKNVVPAQGEPCFDYELNTLKIGDGVKTYEQLSPIGGTGSVTVAADGTSIVLENNVFKLTGFDAAVVGAQPRKGENGLEWVIPSATEGIDDLIADVEELRSDVDALKEKMDGTGESSVEAKIIAKINEFATNITDDGVVNSYQELITYVANHGGEVATMVADITALQGLVGEESVKTQIDTAIASINTKGEENVIESVNLGGTALEVVDQTVTIPIGAGLKASEEIEIAEDGTLSIGTIDFSKVTQTEGYEVVLDGGGATN